jgi:hypothetical protein
MTAFPSVMADDPDRKYLGYVCRDSGRLNEQIKRSRLTVEESRELLRRMDEIIAKINQTRLNSN